MGGMAAQIPVKGDPAANEAAFARVRADKEREASDGHDGTWVAHPGLVPVAREVFDAKMPTPNQLHRKREDVRVTAAVIHEVRPHRVHAHRADGRQGWVQRRVPRQLRTQLCQRGRPEW